jgi:UDP-glucose 4-epimerase
MGEILVTGGAGFMGSHLVRAILGIAQFADYRVTVLDDLSGGFRANVPGSSRVDFIVGSITDVVMVDRLFEERKFDYVYHFAAYAAEGLSHFIRNFNYTNNLIGSVNLINAAIRAETKCFVFASSIAVYGAAQVPMMEKTVPRPEDPYGVAKYAVELDLRAANEMFRLNYVIFRPHNVYGEYQNIGDRYRNVIGIFMNQILQGKPMTIFGDGEQQRSFSYVSEVIPVIARAPLVERARNQVFNVGADQPYTVNSLAVHVAEAMGVKPDVTHLPPRNEVVIAYSDHSKCHEIFGPPKAVSLATGLRAMADWVKSAGARKSRAFDNIEIQRGLPPSWSSRSELDDAKISDEPDAPPLA